MYKLEYKAKLDNCNKIIYISWFVLSFPAQKYLMDIKNKRRHHLIQGLNFYLQMYNKKI